MKKVIALFIAFFIQDVTLANNPAILILGDSLSSAYGIDHESGWPALLEKKLHSKGYSHKVISASVSGDTARTGLSRLKPAINKHKPEIIIITLGGNDGLRGLPFDEIRTSLDKIISISKQNRIKPILAGIRLPPNYGKYYNEKFLQIYQKLAKKHKIPLIPKLLANVAEHKHLMQEDGIHPLSKAQPRIVNNVWPALNQVLSNTSK